MPALRRGDGREEVNDKTGDMQYKKIRYGKDEVAAAMAKVASEILAAAKNMMPVIKFKGNEMHGKRKP